MKPQNHKPSNSSERSESSNPSDAGGLFSRESTTLAPSSDCSHFSSTKPLDSHSQDPLEKQRHEDQVALRQAEKIAYNALSKREYSAQELEEKLLRKNTPVDLVKIVLRQMRELNLQSDERFAESFVRSRINRGQGPVRIEMELKQRGIGGDLAEQHLAAEESFWLAQAKALLARRGIDRSQPVVVDLDPESQWQAQQAQQKVLAGHARFLASRGFRSNTIARALPEITD